MGSGEIQEDGPPVLCQGLHLYWGVEGKACQIRGYHEGLDTPSLNLCSFGGGGSFLSGASWAGPWDPELYYSGPTDDLCFVQFSVWC